MWRRGPQTLIPPFGKGLQINLTLGKLTDFFSPSAEFGVIIIFSEIIIHLFFFIWKMSGTICVRPLANALGRLQSAGSDA